MQCIYIGFPYNADIFGSTRLEAKVGFMETWLGSYLGIFYFWTKNECGPVGAQGSRPLPTAISESSFTE